MKNGLFLENNELLYYENDKLVHAGVIKINDDYYYIGTGGKAVTGVHHVHTVMANDLLKRGTYTFGDDYKLIEGSYVAPKHRKKKKHTHHTKRRSHKRIKLNKKQKLFVNITATALAVLLVIGAVAIGINNFNNQNNSNDENNNASSTIIVSKYDSEVVLCSTGAKKLYDKEVDIEIAKETGEPYRPFVFEYTLFEDVGTLILSQNEDFSNAKEYVLYPDKTSLIIDNLMTGTTYYYKVSTREDDIYGTFKTAESNRFVTIDGVTNTRDIGGYATNDGKTVKQGLLIRGVEMDGLVVPSYYVTNDSVDEIMDVFSFACDFDLREPNIHTGSYTSRLGKNVKHQFYNSPMYGHIFNETYAKNIKRIFSDLADESNYPMYMHCTYGTDRTGTIVYLLQGVLNVSQEDMVNEYALTDLYDDCYATPSSLDVINDGLKKYKGDTIQEKIVDFLKTDIGVTQKEIDSIRRIYLENE